MNPQHGDRRFWIITVIRIRSVSTISHFSIAYAIKGDFHRNLFISDLYEIFRVDKNVGEEEEPSD